MRFDTFWVLCICFCQDLNNRNLGIQTLYRKCNYSAVSLSLKETKLTLTELALPSSDTSRKNNHKKQESWDQQRQLSGAYLPPAISSLCWRTCMVRALQEMDKITCAPLTKEQDTHESSGLKPPTLMENIRQ